jgi:hypothetical protein
VYPDYVNLFDKHIKIKAGTPLDADEITYKL